MSGLINKVKEVLHSDKHNELPEGTHGTHNSRVANAADPRFDSDRDHRANPSTGVGHTTHDTHTTGHNTHTGHTTGAGVGSHNVTGYDDPEGVHGPHSSKMANAADPRVDSDRDHRGTANPSTAIHGTHSTHGTHGTHGTTGLGNTGATGYNSTTTGGAGLTGYNDPTGTHGTHNSRVANAADPRIDSDRDHRGAPGTAGTSHIGSGPGPATHTAGPHKSDVVNKVDPRVDSDLDGSKTFGGNKTFSSGATHGKDPRDAAQAPPSVLREHVGEPVIEHGAHGNGRV